jgi:serine phosphatase RsbU (regulator of sigma subunit)
MDHSESEFGMKNKILLVDDDPLVLSSLRRLLRKNYAISFANSGKAALQQIERNGPYALVISDSMMPEMNGDELLAKVVEVSPETVRMMLTGSLELQTAVNSFNEGHIFQYHLKPWSNDSLIQAIEACLDEYRKTTKNQRHMERVKKSLVHAGMVQQALIPADSPVVDGFDIAGQTIWCDETGGDFFDYLQCEEWQRKKFGLVVGDVSGHGVSAALLMPAVRAVLRDRARKLGGPSDVVSDVNKQIAGDMIDSGLFVSLFYAEIDLVRQHLHWVRAGHEPAIVYDTNLDAFEELYGPGVILGVSEETVYKESTRAIRPGQVILLATDGIHETRNAIGDMFGKNRIKKLLRAHAKNSAQQIITVMADSLARFRQSATIDDDATLLVVKAL